MDVLTFDEKTHSYFADGDRVVSVTQALSAVGKWPTFAGIPDDMREHYMNRGKLVHKAIYFIIRFIKELESQSNPPEIINGIISDYIEKLDSQIKKYVESFNVLRLDSTAGLNIVTTEERVFSERLRVAGTLDIYAVMRFVGGADCFIGDFKCGDHFEEYGYQSAGYVICKFGKPYLTNAGAIPRRVGIHLNRDGKMPKLIEHENTLDYYHFEQAIKEFYSKNREVILWN